MREITVESGDSLWNLARRHLGDPYRWTEIYDANDTVIRAAQRLYGYPNGQGPDLIFPGIRLRLPR